MRLSITQAKERIQQQRKKLAAENLRVKLSKKGAN